MKTGDVKPKHKGKPFVRTDKLTILATADGNKIASFTVTLPGSNPKVFKVLNGNVNHAWKRVCSFAKLK